MNLKKTLFAAAFFYFLIAPFFFHPDLKTIFYLSQFFKNGVFDIYAFIAQNPDKALLGPFVYPPLAYFLFGVLFVPVKLLAGADFVSWLGRGNEAVAAVSIFRYLFLMKLPIILAHLATGALLLRFLKDKEDRRLILLLWFFNPVSIYVIGLMGQFDVIPVMASVLALIVLGKRPYLAALLLGLAAGIKTYPLLLLPFVAVLSSKKWQEQIKVFAVGAFVYLLAIAPFLKTQAFYQSTLVSGLSQRIFDLGLPLGFGERILVIPAIIIALFIFCWRRDAGKPQAALPYFLSIPLLAVAGTHFHPQWALWALPFLILATVKHKLYPAASLFFLGWLAVVLLFNDSFLTWGLFAALDPGVLSLMPPAELIRSFFDPLLLQSLAHTVLAVGAGWITWSAFTSRTYEK